MAVSLNEAWNDFIEEPKIYQKPVPEKPLEQPIQQSDPVSAKISKDDVLSQLHNHNKELHKSNKATIDLMQNMIDQISELRKEEAKRSTVYIIMAAIFFACLFMYIDKLQCKIKNLSFSHHHRVAHRPEHVMQPQSSEYFPWFPLN